MKTLKYTLTALLGLVSIAGVYAASDKDKAASRVEVIFSEPDKFTDAADGPRGSDIGRDGILAEIKDHLIERVSSRLDEGQHLTVTITDIDLAGEIEPWRSPNASNVRIVKEIYFPRIVLSYRLTDANGAVIKEDKRTLSDMNFLNNLNPARNDPRVYEYALLDSWIRQDFIRTKKKS